MEPRFHAESPAEGSEVIMKGRTALIGVLLHVAAIGLSSNGCSELPKPTAPVHQSQWLASYAHPESCLHYMRIGIERKDDLGRSAYLGALADSTVDGVGFHAFFDPAVWNAYPGLKPADWDLPREAQFLPVFTGLYGGRYELKWLPDENYPYDNMPDADHMILHRRYEVRALQQPPADTLLIAVGYADLYFVRISASRWALYRWQDRVDPAVGVQPVDPDQRTFGYRRLNSGTGGGPS
jgi:hypothetical protein